MNLTLNDDETTEPVMHEVEQEKMHFPEAMYYDNYQGPYIAGPSMFEQLQMGLKEASATSGQESQPRRKEKNPSKV